MYFSNCKKIILLLTIINIFHTSIYTNSTPIYTTHTNSTLANNYPDTVESLLEQAYTLPLKIDRIVERLMLMISKFQIRLLKNKGIVVLDILKEIRMSLNIILKDQAIITATHDAKLQAQIIFSLIEICLALYYRLDHAIETNFYYIKPFHINKDSTYLRLSLYLPILKPEKINSNIKHIQNYIKQLNKKIDFITWEIKPTVRFKDVLGFNEEKSKLYSIIRFVENPKKYLLTHTAPKQGLLFTGPTHTNKYFITEAFCGEIANILEKQSRVFDFKFYRISSYMIAKHSIIDILETIMNPNWNWHSGPIVLFIENIDVLLLQRVGNNQLLSQLLTLMNTPLDSDPDKQVILIAATSKSELLYDAMKQHNYLGKEIRFKHPTFQFRKAYLTSEIEKMRLDTCQFDLASIAQKTEGASFKDLYLIIHSAIIRSWTRKQPFSQQLLEEGLDTYLVTQN